MVIRWYEFVPETSLMVIISHGSINVVNITPNDDDDGLVSVSRRDRNTDTLVPSSHLGLFEYPTTDFHPHSDVVPYCINKKLEDVTTDTWMFLLDTDSNYV
mmetsp:Transcript_43408/g.49273  ORF Transcript_43408/g.49273 Transcript_43408/m.49273 type:complete len:101 (+) Transcript_43408:1888-2190(+)